MLPVMSQPDLAANSFLRTSTEHPGSHAQTAENGNSKGIEMVIHYRPQLVLVEMPILRPNFRQQTLRKRVLTSLLGLQMFQAFELVQLQP